jgi:uncharacterized protein with ParB-like and HNH nuclease domain
MSEMLTARESKLSAIIENNTFKIPHFQRFYTWNSDKLLSFIKDLELNDPGYFIGMMIVSNVDGQANIVDGQQRLISVSIIISVLRDLAKFYNLKGENEDVYITLNDHICSKNRYGSYTNKIIMQSGSLDDFYTGFIINGDKNILPNTKESKLIKKNYEFIYEYLNDEVSRLENDSDKIKYLFNIRDKIFDSLIVSININNEDDCYEVFETVNAKGEELSSSDKIKNLILKNCKTDKEEKNIEWNEMSVRLNDFGLTMNDFIRYFWISKFEKVSNKLLYKKVKEGEKNFGSYDDLFNRISEYFKVVELVFSPSKDDLEDYGIGVDYSYEIYLSLSSLRSMKIFQLLFLSIAVLENKNIKDSSILRILKFIEKFGFVYFKICHLAGNRVESRVANVSLMINNKKGNDISDVINKIKTEFLDIYPSDNEIKDSFDDFIEYSESTKKMLKHMFYNIYEIDKNIILLDNFSLEHILPQNPKNMGLNKKDIKPVVNNIGNLTLLERSLNSEVGNKAVIDKVKYLSRSVINENKNESFSMWNSDNYEDCISKRKESLELLIFNYYKKANNL